MTHTARPTQAEQIAQVLGETDILAVDWRDILVKGVFVKVQIGRERMKKRLDYKEDLGLSLDAETAKAMKQIFRLGQKNLLPEETHKRFSRIEDNARNLIRRNSLETELGTFIPITAYETVRNQLEGPKEEDGGRRGGLRKEYFDARDEVFGDYEALCRQVERAYVKAAHNAYKILEKMAPEELKDQRTSEKLKETRYLLNARNRVRAAFPKKEDVLASFRFEASYAFIDLSMLTDTHLSGTSEHTTEEREGESLSDAALLDLRWQQEGQRDLRQKMERMNQEVLAEARVKKQEKIDRFLTDIISQVRAVMYDTTSNVLASIMKNGHLEPRSVFSLRKALEAVSALQFYQDADMDRAVSSIRELLAGYSGKTEKERTVSAAQIEQSLRQIATVMRATLIPLNYEFREEREDEAEATRERTKLTFAQIPLEPTMRQEREAREALGMSLPSWMQTAPDDERTERQEPSTVGTDTLSLVGVEERTERTSW